MKKPYSPKSKESYAVSRTGIESFIQCPRCFYLDKKLGVKQPPGFTFNLNSAVDHLLQQEFDIYRVSGEKHPLIKKYGVDARPVPHKDLDQWRHNFTGIRFLHKPTNLTIFGAIDDLWQNSKGEYIVVDYKATSKNADIVALDQDWQDGYKRQMEVYQWLLRANGYKVSNTGYFVYCNGKKDRKAFDGKLDFDVTLIVYKGSDKWVEKKIFEMKKCLDSNKIPKSSGDCEYCKYVKDRERVE
jgi:hypothetical protein